MRTQFAALICLVCLPALAGENGKKGDEVLPKLAPDAELVKKLADLPENTWMKLPPVKTVGNLSWLSPKSGYRRWGPKPRDYCNKMVWAPDRKRALYCGGGHNLDPYNDVWEYDLASNTWVCLYAADPVPPRVHKKTTAAQRLEWYKKNTVLKDGAIVTKRGAPLRPCHTWWGLTYDTHRRKMLFLESHKGFFATDKASIGKAHGVDIKSELYRGYGSAGGNSWLFTFDPETRKWGKVITGVPKAWEASAMEYLSHSRTIWWQSHKTYLYDEKAGKWNPAAKNGPGPAAETAYHPESKSVVAVGGKGPAPAITRAYDCATKTWKVLDKNLPEGVRIPSATFCYDTIARRFVLYTAGRPGAGVTTTGPRLWLYDMKANKWTQPKPKGEVPKMGKVAGYYDPERNVTVIYSTKETWVYRCKKAP